MIKKLQKKWNVNMKKTFMIGDRKSDKSAAQKSKLYFEYVENNFYKQVICNTIYENTTLFKIFSLTTVFNKTSNSALHWL